MSYIRPIYSGRLGNHIFQHCYCRLLAEQHGKNLNCAGLPFFPNTSGATSPTEAETLLRCRNTLDAEIAAGSYAIRGLFQNYSHFRDHMPRIKEWLHKRPLECFTSDDLLISIRLGDFKRFNVCLPFAYYEQAIRLFDCRNIHLVTDEPSHPFIGRFAKFNARIIAQDDFVHGLSFENIVMSNSTYCWWYTILSGKMKRAVFPIPTHTRNAAYSATKIFNDGLDLRVDDPRITYLYNIGTWGDKAGERGATTLEPAIFFRAGIFRTTSKNCYSPSTRDPRH